MCCVCPARCINNEDVYVGIHIPTIYFLSGSIHILHVTQNFYFFDPPHKIVRTNLRANKLKSTIYKANCAHSKLSIFGEAHRAVC